MTPRLKTLYDKTIIDNLMSKLNLKINIKHLGKK